MIMNATVENNQNGSSKLEGEVELPLDIMVDAAYGDLFTMAQQTIGSASGRKAFKPPLLGNGYVDITRTRDIVGKWGRTEYLPHFDVDVMRYEYLFSNFFSRYITTEEDKGHNQLETKAQEDFLAVCREGWELEQRTLHGDELKPLLTMMSSIVDRTLGTLDLGKVYRSCKHGPNSTGSISLEDAYLHIKGGDMTGTRNSLQQFWHYLQWDHLLREELVEMDDDIRAYVNGLDIDRCNVVSYTTTNFVPKKFDTLRTMCPEHTIPGFLAQGIGAEITKALLKVGIDLKTQPDVHKNLARLASLYPEMGVATVDWSGASDRIWLLLCETVMDQPRSREWFAFINNCCRCEKTCIELSVDGLTTEQKQLRLGQLSCEYACEITSGKMEFILDNTVIRVIITAPMFCTMGNAVTFPLQTLMFYSFLTACNMFAAERICNAEGREFYYADDLDTTSEWEHMQFVSCFGDDGITSSYSKDEILYYADLLNWKVNVSKSFFDGAFRESCGGQYFAGEELGLVRLKRPPISNLTLSYKERQRRVQAFLYVTANVMCEITKLYKIDNDFIYDWLHLWHKHFKLGKILVVPPSYPDGSGLRLEIGLIGWVRDKTVTLPPVLLNETWDFLMPTFDVFKKALQFRCLQSVPRSFTIDDEFHYYHRSLLGLGSGVDIQSQFASFFDLTVKGEAALVDGAIKVKECRLRNVVSHTLDWI